MDCHQKTIFRWLHRLGIEVRKEGNRPKSGKHTDKDWLLKQYKDKKLNLGEIAGKTNVTSSTISNWLKRFGVEVKPEGPRKVVVDTECDYCGKEIKRYTSDLKYNDHKFCSNECYYNWRREIHIGPEHPLWEGGSKNNEAEYLEKRAKASGNWKENRKRARKRDNNKCQFCNSIDNLQVHHIKRIRKGGQNYIGNLITLCASCHRKVELDNL